MNMRIVGLGLISLLVASTAAHAAIIFPPIEDAQASLRVSCEPIGFPSKAKFSVEDLTSLACDRLGAGAGSVITRQIADARTTLTKLITLPSGGSRKEARPQADVQASSKITLSDPNDIFTMGTRATISSASIFGSMRINPTVPTAGPLTEIPVLVSTDGSTTLTSTFFGSSASARSTLSGPGGLLIDDTALNGDSYSFHRTLMLLIGEPYSFQVTAACGVSVGRISATGATLLENNCQALADPTFALDQVAFDAMMGANTFNLADHFAIDLNANILAAVPEPGTLTLLACALCSVWLRGAGTQVASGPRDLEISA